MNMIKKIKLNNKGFTLIELLAVIVILAIVMVVTIPSVIQSMNNARMTSFQNAADTVADWFQKQHDLATMGMADSEYYSWLNSNNCSAMSEGIYGTDNYFPAEQECTKLNANILEHAGISNAANNIDNGLVYYNKYKNKVCVRIYSKSDGQFATGANNNIHADSPGCNIDACYSIYDGESHCEE